MTLSGCSWLRGFEGRSIPIGRFVTKGRKTGGHRAKERFHSACLPRGCDVALRDGDHGRPQRQARRQNRQGRGGENIQHPDAARAAPMFPRQAQGRAVAYRPRGRPKAPRHVRPPLERAARLLSPQMPCGGYPRSRRFGKPHPRGRTLGTCYRRPRHLLQRHRACRCRAEAPLASLRRRAGTAHDTRTARLALEWPTRRTPRPAWPSPCASCCGGSCRDRHRR